MIDPPSLIGGIILRKFNCYSSLNQELKEKMTKKTNFLYKKRGSKDQITEGLLFFLLRQDSLIGIDHSTRGIEAGRNTPFSIAVFFSPRTTWMMFLQLTLRWRILLRERTCDGLRHADQVLYDLALADIQVSLRSLQLQLEFLALLPKGLVERQVWIGAREGLLQHQGVVLGRIAAQDHVLHLPVLFIQGVLALILLDVLEPFLPSKESQEM